LKNELIRQYVAKHLPLGWSPEAIANRLSIDHKGHKISPEAIYQYIYTEKPEWIQYLARCHKKRWKKGHSRKHYKSHIPNRVSIDERPHHIEKRKQEGHWERDSLIGRTGRACLDVKVERKARYVILDKLEQKTAEAVRNSLIFNLGILPENLRRSCTYDNGTENTDHGLVNAALGTKSYFCHPYASWQKGTVENTNGLIRRFFPKKTDFDNVSIEQIKKVESLLNNRPRKCLNYKTPKEVFDQCGALKR
jgi:IS30 family transposase